MAVTAMPLASRQTRISGRFKRAGCLVRVLHARLSRNVRIVTSAVVDPWRFPEHKDRVIPEQLLPCDPNLVDVKEHQATIYTVRLCTSLRRRSALSVPGAGVQLCLVGKDGRAVLHRVSSEVDLEERIEALTKICAAVEGHHSVGIHCTLSTASAYSTPTPNAHPQRRFQEGSVDEVSFLAPDLGPLAGLMVAPEAGSWTLEEAMVVSSRTRHTDRFVLRESIGDKARDSAAYLTPVPVGALVYGSGDSAKYLTQEEAASLRSVNLDEYKSTKQRLLATTAALTAGGTAVAAAAAGSDAAIPFVLGGAASLLYSLVLQSRVDGLQPDAATSERERGLSSPPSSKAPSPSASSSGPSLPSLPPSVITDIVAGSSYRGALAAAAVVLALWSVTGSAGEVPADGSQAWPMMRLPTCQLVYGTLGFLTYKLAVVTVALTSKDKQPMEALQALDRTP